MTTETTNTTPNMSLTHNPTWDWTITEIQLAISEQTYKRATGQQLRLIQQEWNSSVHYIQNTLTHATEFLAHHENYLKTNLITVVLTDANLNDYYHQFNKILAQAKLAENSTPHPRVRRA